MIRLFQPKPLISFISADQSIPKNLPVEVVKDIRKARGQWVGFVPEKDTISEDYIGVLVRAVKENPSLQLVYTDEAGYFSPDFSLDLLEAFPYMGYAFIIRKDLVHGENPLAVPHDALPVLKRDQVLHIARPLYNHVLRKEDYGLLPEQTEEKNTVSTSDAVSIIIPSKDNPEIFERCVNSIRTITKDVSFEIICVDNGSTEENQKKYRSLADRYVYEPMDFNFSRMCNLGAKQSAGSYLLFLNDDTEVIQEDWLKKMVHKAQIHRIGAVGAKLLYPDGLHIQHAGIMNTHIGLGHALQYFPDDIMGSEGRNRLPYNLSAVTAACLMVRKEVFEETGGFDESFPVAYNDVELCFRLYGSGYDNVILNDVRLLHYESYSRGKDEESEEKTERRKKELARLYECHPSFYRHDPYYNPNLVQDSIIFPDPWPSLFQKPAEVRKINHITQSPEECACSIDAVESNDSFLALRGWMNCNDSVTVILQNETETCSLDTEVQYRPDLVSIFGEQADHSGFRCFAWKEDLPKGTFSIMLCGEGTNVNTGVIIGLQ